MSRRRWYRDLDDEYRKLVKEFWKLTICIVILVITVVAAIIKVIHAAAYLDAADVDMACYKITTIVMIICIIVAAVVRIEKIWILQIATILIAWGFLTIPLIVQITGG